MDWLGEIHLFTAILALGAGTLVVARRKGTHTHRLWGRIYVGAMLALNLTALCIYDLFGGFGPFHAAALFSLATLAAGIWATRRRRPKPGWRLAHAYFMSWSYVGLLAAAASEVSTRYLGFDFGWTVAIATGIVVLVGAIVIQSRVPKLAG